MLIFRRTTLCVRPLNSVCPRFERGFLGSLIWRRRRRKPGLSSDRLQPSSMISFKRGDVVLVDLGYVAKVRPCIVVSIPNADSQRNMSVVAPLTTEIRGGECE